MTAPWTKLSEESTRVGFRKLLKRLFRLPDGPEIEFVIKDEGFTVCVLAMNENGKIILAEQFRPGPELVLRELPGGGVEEDEPLEDAACRELLEETGYAGDMQFVGKYHACAYSNRVSHIFVATNCKRIAEPKLDEAERINIVESGVEEFLFQLRKGELTDAAGAWMALSFLNIR